MLYDSLRIRDCMLCLEVACRMIPASYLLVVNSSARRHPLCSAWMWLACRLRNLVQVVGDVR